MCKQSLIGNLKLTWNGCRATLFGTSLFLTFQHIFLELFFITFFLWIIVHLQVLTGLQVPSGGCLEVSFSGVETPTDAKERLNTMLGTLFWQPKLSLIGEIGVFPTLPHSFCLLHAERVLALLFGSDYVCYCFVQKASIHLTNEPEW